MTVRTSRPERFKGKGRGPPAFDDLRPAPWNSLIERSTLMPRTTRHHSSTTEARSAAGFA